MSYGADEFLLWCCLSHDPDHKFPVVIKKNAAVGQLKDEIKQKKDPLRDLDADNLDLYQVSIPDEDLASSLPQIQNPQEDSKLNYKTPVSALFKDPPQPNHLHIVVKIPVGESSISISA
jgi:hypothetical protein